MDKPQEIIKELNMLLFFFLNPSKIYLGKQTYVWCRLPNKPNCEKITLNQII